MTSGYSIEIPTSNFFNVLLATLSGLKRADAKAFAYQNVKNKVVYELRDQLKLYLVSWYRIGDTVSIFNSFVCIYQTNIYVLTKADRVLIDPQTHL